MYKQGLKIIPGSQAGTHALSSSAGLKIQVDATISPLFKKPAAGKPLSTAFTRTTPLSLPGASFTSVPVSLQAPAGSTGSGVKKPTGISPSPTPVPMKFPYEATGIPIIKPGSAGSTGTALPVIPFPPKTIPQVQPVTPSTTSYVSGTTRTIEQQIFYYTNEERLKAGKEPYILDNQLADIAREDAIDMAKRGFFDHINPDGESPTDRAKRHGYPTQKDFGSYYRIGVGENIAWVQHFQGSPDELGEFIVEAWMNSPGHRANILDTEGSLYTNIGVGVAYDPVNDTYLAAQEFF